MIEISSDKSKLDIPIIHNFLKETYWAKGRTIEEVSITIENSFCLGFYLNNEQIGFCRIVTDYVVFAYLMDVFILEEHRGKGYSSLLMNALMNDEQLKNISIWRLATSDAHFLYQKFGFNELSNPEKLMEKITVK